VVDDAVASGEGVGAAAGVDDGDECTAAGEPQPERTARASQRSRFIKSALASHAGVRFSKDRRRKKGRDRPIYATLAKPSDARAELDDVLSVMFAQGANQLLLSKLGIHFFTDSELMLVGKLQTPLDAMLDHLRDSSEMGAEGRDGIFAVVSAEHPMELVRIDLLAHGADPRAGALIRRSSAKTWPRPMLPIDYRLAA
jgi:hypothetical protein